MKKIAIYHNEKHIANLYQKSNGTLTTTSSNDLIARNLTVILTGATLLGVVSHFA